MMKITPSLLLFCLLQPYSDVVAYLLEPMRLLPPGGRHALRYMDYERMNAGLGFYPVPFLPQGHVPYWGYDERIPLARYSDFNDYRRGAPSGWGPNAPMGAFAPHRGGLLHPRLDEIRRNPNLSDREVQDLFFLWNHALATLDPDAVARRYARSSVLLPTVSDVPRTDYNSIRAYFVDFLKKRPQGMVLQSHVTQGRGWCMDAGIYEFVMGSTGEKVTARYTFLYTYEDGEWKISHHHSSTMPEKSGKTKTANRARWLGDGVMMKL